MWVNVKVNVHVNVHVKVNVIVIVHASSLGLSNATEEQQVNLAYGTCLRYKECKCKIIGTLKREEGQCPRARLRAEASST